MPVILVKRLFYVLARADLPNMEPVRSVLIIAIIPDFDDIFGKIQSGSRTSAGYSWCRHEKN